ncbi:hypothetical protein PR003_g13188 [Phytophthora rubi]|uniref:RxLR effector protein n=1 Tax=Phytophthora rubi TaxID=129364 RepID=A0A6A3LKC7_9STRA|nr:hypothetical protein PR002_g12696 [Phytophthora rubi]KAE9025460.1 hypothetical protein PR001_g12413 [Phytophthora rubi]KAE9335103.1 hypothetical protein PR003_g13188 [Phytophthora rubi]
MVSASCGSTFWSILVAALLYVSCQSPGPPARLQSKLRCKQRLVWWKPQSVGSLAEANSDST